MLQDGFHVTDAIKQTIGKYFYGIKGTVSVISSDPPCTNGNAQFSTVPIKSLSHRAWIQYQCL